MSVATRVVLAVVGITSFCKLSQQLEEKNIKKSTDLYF